MTTDAQIDLVTNPIRTLMPNTTVNVNPMKFLDADVESVKSVILYADSIRLRSYLFDLFEMCRSMASRERMPLHSLVITISAARDMAAPVMKEYGVDPQKILARSTAGEFLKNWHKTPTVDVDRLMEFAELHWKEIQPLGSALFGSNRKFAEREDWSSLAPAVDAGLVTIGGWAEVAPGRFEEEAEYVDRAGEFIYSLLAGGKQPLAFDGGAEKMLRLAESPKKDLELTKRVFSMVPSFSRASISELVDIRSELEGPLTRFRAAMIEISADLPDPGEKDYGQEVNDAYRRLVAPSLSEIDELSKENSYLRQLADAAVDVRTWIPSAVGLGIGIAAFTGIAEISTAAAGLASIPLAALRAKSKQQREIKQNHFFFLWRIKNLAPQ